MDDDLGDLLGPSAPATKPIRSTTAWRIHEFCRLRLWNLAMTDSHPSDVHRSVTDFSTSIPGQDRAAMREMSIGGENKGQRSSWRQATDQYRDDGGHPAGSRARSLYGPRPLNSVRDRIRRAAVDGARTPLLARRGRPRRSRPHRLAINASRAGGEPGNPNAQGRCKCRLARPVLTRSGFRSERHLETLLLDVPGAARVGAVAI